MSKWDKALQNFTADIQGGGHDGESLSQEYHRIKAELERRLVPLLEAVANLQPHIWEDSFLSKDCEHTDYTRSVVALREELTKWLK